MNKLIYLLTLCLYVSTANSEVIPVTIALEDYGSKSCELTISGDKFLSSIKDKSAIQKLQWGSRYTKTSTDFIINELSSSGDIINSSCSVKLSNSDFTKSLKFCSLASYTSIDSQIRRPLPIYSTQTCSIEPTGKGFKLTTKNDDIAGTVHGSPSYCKFNCLVE